MYKRQDDDDDDTSDDETSEEQVLTVTHLEQSPAELIPSYKDLINKVRKVVKIFKKSPTKDACLQKYVREDLGKELSLILDCKTRWSSLYNMLERFHVLKGCISKALIDEGTEIKFSDEEWTKLKELTLSLQLVKLGIEVLCRRDSTLLMADTTLRFILEKLDKQQGEVSADLATALRVRIKERWIVLSGIILCLHNPKKYASYLNTPDDTFPVPKKSCVRLEIKKICERMLTLDKNIDDKADKSESSEDEESNIEVNLSLQEELEMQLNKEKKDTCSVNMDERGKNFEKNIKTEMTEYECSGIKGKYLSLVHDYLNTITPTSVEAERAFSAAGYICSSIRSRLGDKTLDTICFLRSYFQKKI